MSTQQFGDLSAGERRRATVEAVLRFALTFALVLGVYYLLPLRAEHSIADVISWLLLGLVALVVVTGWQFRQIGRARFPTFRATQALGLTLPFFLCAFAAAYVLLAANDPGAFTQPLSHTAALYFAVVVFGTVGFGDIAPVSDVARLLVASQVLLDLVFLALVVRTFFASSRRTITKRSAKGTPD